MPTAGQPVPLDFARSSTPGLLPGESEGRLINALLEKLGDKFLFRRAAGLAQLGDIAGAAVNPRGSFAYGDFIYAVYGSVGAGVRWHVSGGTPLQIGSYPVAPDGWVTFARNNRQTAGGPDIVAAVSTGGSFVLDPSTPTLAAYPDDDLPSTVNSVVSLGPYFIWSDPPTNRLWASEVNSTNQEPLSFATAEASPDALIRLVRSGNAVLAFGESTIEPWLDMGASPFPLRRHTTVIEVGLKEFGAVAGSQTGWDRGILFVAHDGTVRDLGGGYTAKRVSTPDVERFIADSVPYTFDAQVYTDRGQSIWSLTTDRGTWQYHLDAGSWSERQSNNGRWRATATVKANNTWYALDKEAGRLLTLSGQNLEDVDTPLPFLAQSAPSKAFPLRASIPAVHLDFTRGNGGAVDFSYSLDGGRNFSAWETFSLGGTGEDDGPIIVNRLGQTSTHGLIVRVRVTDQINFSFMGAAVPAGLDTR